MRGKLSAVGGLAGLMAIAAAITMPVIGADSSIADTSASDAAANLVPADAGTPTAPANDIDDTRVTAQIRSALAGDKSLSSMAHNVSIATNPQAVVLRGQVSSAEKDRVEALASQYAGTRQVVSQLLVKDP
jgi:osmotically-inducible protein OsmY